MPTHNVTTVTSKSIWKTPDGQREIFELGMDYQGQPLKAKTFSKEISAVGWNGDVETYEREGRNGSETFVKQPEKEGNFGGGAKPSYTPRDDSHIKAQWAIGQAITVLADKGSVDLELTEALAKDLFAMVDRVKGEKEPANTDVVVTGEELDKAIETLDKQGELPWASK